MPEQVRLTGVEESEAPDQQVSRLLAAARRAGDRRGEATALADLGVIYARGGDSRRAVAVLEEALAVARQLGARSIEHDVLGNLGLALLADGQPARALEVLEQELATAVAAGDRFAEKLSLDNFGMVYSELGDHVRALAYYGRALAIARAVEDRQHEADLLWLSAVQHAELGQRDRAVAVGQEAATLFARLGNPQAGQLADHLRRYEAAGPDAGLARTLPVATAFGSFLSTDLSVVTPPREDGPGLLRMALTAARSVAKFVAAGLKTTAADVQRRRLEVCDSCPHHTSVRCKLCGCFTRAKVIMPHEQCPIGKWPA